VVAAFLNPLPELGDRRPVRIEGDGRGLCDGVGVDGNDAGAVLERALHHGLLGRVVQPADVDNRARPDLAGGAHNEIIIPL
jgi:hypothetical protein